MVTLDDDGDWESCAHRVLATDVPATPAPSVIEWPGTFASGSRIFLLDESTRPTGSLKHTTMQFVFRRLLTDGHLRPGRPVAMASAGNAAVAGAYWCRRLGLPCTVVIPASTAPAKAERIQREGADIVPHSPPVAIYDEARRIAEVTGGFYLDHFTHAAAAATEHEWPPAAELFRQIGARTQGFPTVAIAGLGSGATAAGLHAYTRSRGLECLIVGVDAENSAYLRGWLYDVDGYGTGMPSRIEGIGRPVLPPAFDRESIDLVVQAPDAASIAGARRLRTLLGKPVGPSSGANLWAALRHARRAPRPETVATFVADAHPHYRETYHNDAWCRTKDLDLHEYADYFES